MEDCRSGRSCWSECALTSWLPKSCNSQLYVISFASGYHWSQSSGSLGRGQRHQNKPILFDRSPYGSWSICHQRVLIGVWQRETTHRSCVFRSLALRGFIFCFEYVNEHSCGEKTALFAAVFDILMQLFRSSTVISATTQLLLLLLASVVPTDTSYWSRVPSNSVRLICYASFLLSGLPSDRAGARDLEVGSPIIVQACSRRQFCQEEEVYRIIDVM